MKDIRVDVVTVVFYDGGTVDVKRVTEFNKIRGFKNV